MNSAMGDAISAMSTGVERKVRRARQIQARQRVGAEQPPGRDAGGLRQIVEKLLRDGAGVRRGGLLAVEDGAVALKAVRHGGRARRDQLLVVKAGERRGQRVDVGGVVLILVEREIAHAQRVAAHEVHRLVRRLQGRIGRGEARARAEDEHGRFHREALAHEMRAQKHREVHRAEKRAHEQRGRARRKVGKAVLEPPVVHERRAAQEDERVAQRPAHAAFLPKALCAVQRALCAAFAPHSA